MRYTQGEKLEIIRLVEGSDLSVKQTVTSEYSSALKYNDLCAGQYHLAARLQTLNLGDNGSQLLSDRATLRGNIRIALGT